MSDPRLLQILYLSDCILNTSAVQDGLIMVSVMLNLWTPYPGRKGCDIIGHMDTTHVQSAACHLKHEV